MKKVTALIVAVLVLIQVFAYLPIPVGASDTDVGAASNDGVDTSAVDGGYISSCVYDKGASKIRLKGTLATSTVREYQDGALAIFALDIGDEVSDIENGKLEPVCSGIAMTTLISVDVVPEVAELIKLRCARFVIAAEVNGGYIRLTEPTVPTAETGSLSCNFKGMESTSTAALIGADARTVIVEADVGSILSAGNSGYLYTVAGSTFKINKEYVSVLDSRVRILSGAGADVIVRLVNINAEGQRQTMTASSAEDLVYAYVAASFIADRYSTDEYGTVCGIIDGQTANNRGSLRVNGDMTDEAYVAAYYTHLRAVAAAINDSGTGLALIVPLSCEWSESDTGVSAYEFVSDISKLANLYGGPDFTVMIESGQSPSAVSDANPEGGQVSGEADISVDNIETVVSAIAGLAGRYGHISRRLIYLWKPSGDLSGEALAAAYVYSCYSLYSRGTGISAFVVSLTDRELSGGTYVADEELSECVRYIDVSGADERWDSDGILAYLGLTSWNGIISESRRRDLSARVINSDKLLTDEVQGVTGTYVYFDFVSTVGLNGWYSGAGCDSVSLDRDEFGTALVAKLNGVASSRTEYGFAAYGYGYGESFRYTDAIAIEFSIDGNAAGSGDEYGLLITLGGDGFMNEYSGEGFVSGQKYTVYVDVSSMTADNVAQYMRICSKRVTGENAPYELNVYSIKALSTKYGDAELEANIVAERERMMDRGQSGTEDFDPAATVAIGAVLALTALTVIIITIRRRKVHRDE